MAEALKRANIKPELVEEVILGCVLTAGQGQNPTRQVLIRAGIPKEIPGTTINKVCASGLKSVMMAAQAIKAGDADIDRGRRHGIHEPGPLSASGRPLGVPDE